MSLKCQLWNGEFWCHYQTWQFLIVYKYWSWKFQWRSAVDLDIKLRVNPPTTIYSENGCNSFSFQRKPSLGQEKVVSVISHLYTKESFMTTVQWMTITIPGAPLLIILTVTKNGETVMVSYVTPFSSTLAHMILTFYYLINIVNNSYCIWLYSAAV